MMKKTAAALVSLFCVLSWTHANAQNVAGPIHRSAKADVYCFVHVEWDGQRPQFPNGPENKEKSQISGKLSLKGLGAFQQMNDSLPTFRVLPEEVFFLKFLQEQDSGNPPLWTCTKFGFGSSI